MLKISEPKRNPPGTKTALEDPSSSRGRKVGEVSAKYSKFIAHPAIRSQKVQ